MIEPNIHQLIMCWSMYRSCRHKPGDVISVQEHPLDQGKVQHIATVLLISPLLCMCVCRFW